MMLTSRQSNPSCHFKPPASDNQSCPQDVRPCPRPSASLFESIDGHQYYFWDCQKSSWAQYSCSSLRMSMLKCKITIMYTDPHEGKGHNGEACIQSKTRFLVFSMSRCALVGASTNWYKYWLVQVLFGTSICWYNQKDNTINGDSEWLLPPRGCHRFDPIRFDAVDSIPEFPIRLSILCTFRSGF